MGRSRRCALFRVFPRCRSRGHYRAAAPSGSHGFLRTGTRFRPDLSLIRRILQIGVPNGLENSLFQLGRILVVSIISLFGTTQIAANAVANNLDAVAVIPGQAMSLAMITVVGQCIGARDIRRRGAWRKS